jgi:hypothetical protein
MNKMNTWRRKSEEEGEDDDVDDGGEHALLQLEVLEGGRPRLLHQSGTKDLPEKNMKKMIFSAPEVSFLKATGLVR